MHSFFWWASRMTPSIFALLADIGRYIFDNNDLPGSVRQKLRLSFAEFTFAETAMIRNHGSFLLLRYSIHLKGPYSFFAIVTITSPIVITSTFAPSSM